MLRLVVQDEPPGPPAVPVTGECLVCFLGRMVSAYGCGNRLVFAQLWRDRMAPRAPRSSGGSAPRAATATARC